LEGGREREKGDNRGCTHSTPHTVVTSYTGTSWINMENLLFQVLMYLLRLKPIFAAKQNKCGVYFSIIHIKK
jgi:hypothetical protein